MGPNLAECRPGKDGQGTMLMQTNSYYVPPDKRAEHQRLMRRFRQALYRLGCEYFAVYEQVGVGFAPALSPGRYVQVMHFRDRRHHQAVQDAERQDRASQELIQEFSQLIDLPAQQEQGSFIVDYYTALPDGASEPPQPPTEPTKS